MKIRSLILCALATASFSGHAGDRLVHTGTEWSPLGGYSYVGTLSALGPGSLGHGWVMRHWLDRVTYEYESDGAGIQAESYAYAPALGYQFPLGRSRASVYGALRLAHTELSPNDPSNADRGTRSRFSIHAELGTPLGKKVENQLIAQAQFGNGGYFARDRLVIRVLGRYVIGPEFVLKGSREYSGWQAGLTFGGISLGSSATLLLRGGTSVQRDQPSEGYAGAEVAVNL